MAGQDAGTHAIHPDATASPPAICLRNTNVEGMVRARVHGPIHLAERCCGRSKRLVAGGELGRPFLRVDRGARPHLAAGRSSRRLDDARPLLICASLNAYERRWKLTDACHDPDSAAAAGVRAIRARAPSADANAWPPARWYELVSSHRALRAA